MKILLCFSILMTGILSAQSEFQPAGSELTMSIQGDLDDDKVPEMVNIYTLKDTTDIGNVRELQILKRMNGKWMVLEKSRKALLPSKGGGMSGDPLDDVEISKGILIINQAGGSSWKWANTDKYRFQHGNFELIGYSTTYGRLGDYWADVDFNLSTGKLVYTKEVDDTTDPENGKSELETIIKKSFKINLRNRSDFKQTYIILPKTKAKIYL